MTNFPGTAANGGRSVPITERRFLAPFILITSLFFLWAFGVNLNDILIPHLKKAFGLTDFQSSFIQVAFFGGYFLAAFPAGRVMEKIGMTRNPADDFDHPMIEVGNPLRRHVLYRLDAVNFRR